MNWAVKILFILYIISLKYSLKSLRFRIHTEWRIFIIWWMYIPEEHSPYYEKGELGANIFVFPFLEYLRSSYSPSPIPSRKNQFFPIYIEIYFVSAHKLKRFPSKDALRCAPMVMFSTCYVFYQYLQLFNFKLIWRHKTWVRLASIHCIEVWLLIRFQVLTEIKGKERNKKCLRR